MQSLYVWLENHIVSWVYFYEWYLVKLAKTVLMATTALNLFLNHSITYLGDYKAVCELYGQSSVIDINWSYL